MLGDAFLDALAGMDHFLFQPPVFPAQLPEPGLLPVPVVVPKLHAGGHGPDEIVAEALMLRVKAPAVIVDDGAVALISPAHRLLPGDIELLLGLTACGAPVAAVTLPDTVQVEKTQTAETAVLYEDADGREVSPRRAALTEWRWSVADDTIAEVDPSGIVTGLRGGSTTLTLQSADGKISASCPVQVSSPLRGIALDDYTLYFDDELVTWITADGTRESDYAYASRVGAVCHLLPEDTTDHPAVTYHIADERIARFDGSWLVPVNYGTTTLTADCGGFTAQCTVTVVRPEEQP